MTYRWNRRLVAVANEELLRFSVQETWESKLRTLARCNAGRVESNKIYKHEVLRWKAGWENKLGSLSKKIMQQMTADQNWKYKLMCMASNHQKRLLKKSLGQT